MNRTNPNAGDAGRTNAPTYIGLSGSEGVVGDTATASALQILAVNVPEAARLLGICERLCWVLIRSGELVSFKARSRRLVAIAEIEAYIRRQQDAERTRAA